MNVPRRDFVRLMSAGLAAALWAGPKGIESLGVPHFEPVQTELFAATGGQPNRLADYDNDGRLNLCVGFKKDLPNRL